MRLLLPLGLMLCLLAATAPAQEAPSPTQTMTVDQFLTRHAAIKANIKTNKDKSKAIADATELMLPVAQSITRYKAEIEAQKQLGARPRACPRKGTSSRFTSDEIAAELAQLPPEERAKPFEYAFFKFLDARHPCPVA